MNRIAPFSNLIFVESTSHLDRFFMDEALRLARKGLGHTKTNPLVGAVLVQHRSGRTTLIGRGFHRGYGLPHAEVEAVWDARRRGHRSLAGTTMYVNLEPCCHTGKTPPCTDLIIRERIGRVVCATTDPFPLVAGRGISALRSAGIRVTTGVGEEDGYRLNRFFFKHVTTGLPWVTVKIGQSLDGRIATKTGMSKWITGDLSRRQVHRLRSEYDAIVVGAGTVLQDDPRLNVRLVKGRHPWKVVIDGRLRVPLSAAIFRDRPEQVIVATSRASSLAKKEQLCRRGVHVREYAAAHDQRIPFRRVLTSLLKEFQLASLMVEGGSSIIGQFLRQRLVDEVHLFVAPLILGDGLPAVPDVLTRTMRNALRFREHEWTRVGSDMLFHGVV